jgi:tRNA-specific 2-thiouridylase
MLTARELARTLFPIGEMTKPEVRATASAMGLRTATKPESMEICFVGQGDYRGFLRRHAPSMLTPGPLVDTEGRRVGTHQGIAGYTIGQRRGLGVATGSPRYVVSIRPSTGTIVIGGRDDLSVEVVELSGLTTTRDGPLSGPVEAQYRAHGAPVPARVDGNMLVFDEPQTAVAPGQTVAFYQGDRVLGGALIVSTS